MNSLILRTDRTGFPMVYIDELDAYMHWLPVTKIQYEQFLCAQEEEPFDTAWYNQLLQLNPRATPERIGQSNYWQAFITGIVPGEAQAFARWCGEGYSIPTLEDWCVAYTALKGLPPASSPVTEQLAQVDPHLSRRASTLLNQLEAASLRACVQANYERTLVHQMFLRLGVMEWVDVNDPRSKWGGMGETPTLLHGNLFSPDHMQPSRPHLPESNRLHYFGFRLLWRA